MLNIGEITKISVMSLYLRYGEKLENVNIDTSDDPDLYCLRDKSNGFIIYHGDEAGIENIRDGIVTLRPVRGTKRLTTFALTIDEFICGAIMAGDVYRMNLEAYIKYAVKNNLEKKLSGDTSIVPIGDPGAKTHIIISTRYDACGDPFRFAEAIWAPDPGIKANIESQLDTFMISSLCGTDGRIEITRVGTPALKLRVTADELLLLTADS